MKEIVRKSLDNLLMKWQEKVEFLSREQIKNGGCIAFVGFLNKAIAINECSIDLMNLIKENLKEE